MRYFIILLHDLDVHEVEEIMGKRQTIAFRNRGAGVRLAGTDRR